MRNIILGIIISLLISECQERHTVKMAIKYNCDSPLSALVYSYCRSYLELPKSNTDLITYVDLYCDFYGPGGFDFIENGGDTQRIRKELTRRRGVRMCSYPNICYIYCKKYKTGAVIKFSPSEEQKKRYRPYRDNWWWEYSPAFIDSDGHVLFLYQDFQYSEPFSVGLKSIREKFNNYLTVDTLNFTPRYFLVSFSDINGVGLKMDISNNIFSYNKKSSVYTIVPDWGAFSEDYISEITAYITRFMKQNPEVSEIRILTPLYGGT